MGLVDLHIHTAVSDASTTVEETLLLAASQGVSHLSITDHETIAGVEQAMALGKRMGVTIIPGIELSAFDFTGNKKVHILGYDIDPTDTALRAFGEIVIRRRQQASLEMMEKVIVLGYRISIDEVASIAQYSTNIFKQHILVALKNKGYTNELFGSLKTELFAGNGIGKASVEVQYPPAEEAVRVVREAGGIPVLAHPGLYENWDIVKKLVAAGLQGIEAYHPGHDQTMTDRALQLAQKYSLVQTAGSDYHGAFGETLVEMGFSPSMVSPFLNLAQIKKYM